MDWPLTEVAAGCEVHRSCGWMMLVEVALNDAQVAGVRLEEIIRHRADYWNHAQHPVDADILAHPRDLPLAHAKVARFPGEIGAEPRSDRRTDAGDEVQHD